MRIISIFVTLLTAWTMNFPQIALASGNTNTKTEFEVKIADINYEKIPYNYEGYIPIKSAVETKNEAILAKWKVKQAHMWNSLPSGKFKILATNYTAAADECGKSDGITASGIKVHQGTLACPPQYPFGTKIDIEGYGTYICEDRGGAIKGNHFDIYTTHKKDAFAFGKRNLIAEVVK